MSRSTSVPRGSAVIEPACFQAVATAAAIDPEAALHLVVRGFNAAQQEYGIVETARYKDSYAVIERGDDDLREVYAHYAPELERLGASYDAWEALLDAVDPTAFPPRTFDASSHANQDIPF